MNQKSLHKNHHIFQVLLLVIYFVLLSLIFTRPLVEYLSTSIVGTPGDAMGFIWQIGWIKQAIFDLHQLPYKSPLLNYPYGYNLYTSEISPLQILIALPFTLIDGPVLGYNVSMLSTFVLAGLCMFYWVYSKSESWQAGIIAGTAYTIAPFHAAHFLIGHLNICAIQWFPLFFMGLFGILENKEYSKKNVLLTGIGLSLIALSSIYYIYFTLLIGAIITHVFLFKKGTDLWKSKQFWKQLPFAGLISLPFLILSIAPYIYLHLASGMESRELSDVSFYSASPTDFLLPFTLHPLWGEWVGETFPRNLWEESTLYLGIPLIVLFMWGWARKSNPYKKYLKYLCLGAAIAVILAMGTQLTWMEQPVSITLPAWLSGFVGQKETTILLPGYLLFRWLPFYGRMRVWMRYGIFAMLFICAGAGLSISNLLQNKSRLKQYLISIPLLGLVLLDFWVKPYPLTEIQPRQVDEWLAEQPWGGLVQLPLEESYEKMNMYYTLTNQKGLVGTFKETPSYRYFTLQTALENFPDETSIATLKAEQIHYILVDETVYTVDDAFISTCEPLGLEFAISIDGQSVFLLAQ